MIYISPSLYYEKQSQMFPLKIILAICTLAIFVNLLYIGVHIQRKIITKNSSLHYCRSSFTS